MSYIFKWVYCSCKTILNRGDVSTLINKDILQIRGTKCVCAKDPVNHMIVLGQYSLQGDYCRMIICMEIMVMQACPVMQFSRFNECFRELYKHDLQK